MRCRMSRLPATPSPATGRSGAGSASGRSIDARRRPEAYRRADERGHSGGAVNLGARLERGGLVTRRPGRGRALDSARAHRHRIGAGERRARRSRARPRRLDRRAHRRRSGRAGAAVRATARGQRRRCRQPLANLPPLRRAPSSPTCRDRVQLILPLTSPMASGATAESWWPDRESSSATRSANRRHCSSMSPPTSLSRGGLVPKPSRPWFGTDLPDSYWTLPHEVLLER
jgi:hypothetical protein